jgi:hypothetical protein
VHLSEPVGGPVRAIVRGVKGMPIRFVLTLSFNDPAGSSG